MTDMGMSPVDVTGNNLHRDLGGSGAGKGQTVGHSEMGKARHDLRAIALRVP
jgi:hypothetical protein